MEVLNVNKYKTYDSVEENNASDLVYFTDGIETLRLRIRSRNKEICLPTNINGEIIHAPYNSNTK